MILKEGEATTQRAAELVMAGGVLAFCTDTFYGLGADPFNRAALTRLNDLKGREGKPILVVISDASAASRFILESSTLFEAITARHWPGALTVVLKAKAEVPELLTAGSGTIGLRLPDDEKVRALTRACGGALTATSANLAGRPPARTALEVASYFPTELDLIIDGGPAPGDKPSTVLDVSQSDVRLIREGAVSRDALRETLKTFSVNI